MAIDKSVIGKKSAVYSMTVEAGKIREFAAAINETSDIFWDDEKFPELIAPPTFSHVLRSGKMQLLMSDCGLDATKFLHGEHDISYERPLRAGDRLSYQLELVDLYEKEGRRSGPMDIVVLETKVTDASGALVQTIRQSFVAKR